MAADSKAIADAARQIRRDIVTMVHQAGDGHPGPALSITDIVASLYFGLMNVDPAQPAWPDRDRFVLSKGHACTALYAALARKGYFSTEAYPGFRSLHSILQGHPYQGKTPGLDATTGSLGHGVSVGLGMAMAGRVAGKTFFTYVIIGDGEQEEGIVWEAATAAVKFRAGRLIVFADCNGFQSGGTVDEVSGLLPIRPKWEAFGWHCQAIDGHDVRAIVDAVEAAKAEPDRPSVILAKTVKGKGVSFMENNNDWHKRVPTKAELDAAIGELEDRA